MSTQRDEDRFVALETKIAYQEKLLADLSDVIAEQSTTIEALQKRVETVERAFREAKMDDKDPLPHEPPPHY